MGGGDLDIALGWEGISSEQINYMPLIFHSTMYLMHPNQRYVTITY